MTWVSAMLATFQVPYIAISIIFWRRSIIRPGGGLRTVKRALAYGAARRRVHRTVFLRRLRLYRIARPRAFFLCPGSSVSIVVSWRGYVLMWLRGKANARAAHRVSLSFTSERPGGFHASCRPLAARRCPLCHARRHAYTVRGDKRGAPWAPANRRCLVYTCCGFECIRLLA